VAVACTESTTKSAQHGWGGELLCLQTPESADQRATNSAMIWRPLLDIAPGQGIKWEV
jgi:hypothetical protein